MSMSGKSPEAFRTISEVADDLELPQHVLRFWETRFAQIKPLKRGGGRRYYRPEDIDLLRGIRHLLYSEGYTIKGVQRILKERGVRQVAAGWREADDDEQVEDRDGEREFAPAGSSAAAPAQSPADRAPHEAKPEEAPAAASGGSSSDIRRELKSALAELAECKRILEEARHDT